MNNSDQHIVGDGQGNDRLAWLEVVELRAGALAIEYFGARTGQAWCLLGHNRSGIDLFARILGREVKPEQCRVLKIPQNMAVVGFRQQQELFEQEVRRDDSDFLDYVDPGTPARAFLGSSKETAELIRLFRLDYVLDVGYRRLSSGESRKLLLLAAISHGARHLLIENPYDGLDVAACREFDQAMVRLRAAGIESIVTLTSGRDVPSWCTHLAIMDAGSIVGQGPRGAIEAGPEKNGAETSWSPPALACRRDANRAKELVRLVAGRARYGGRIIFSGLDFVVRRGEHTLITGPNGAGKSTLLAMITGDHPDCYTNELYIMGIRRGSGESVQQLKKEMGIVGPALHREHYIPGSALQVVISGFFDSIGLYRRFTREQAASARSWLARIGLAHHERTPFRRLSYAEQRLALIARALIKQPSLLIFDEPTQGLDDRNRRNLLDFLETVAEQHVSTIIYVSHRHDEYRDFFRSRLRMDPGHAGEGRAVTAADPAQVAGR